MSNRRGAERWRWRGTVALAAVALGFVIYPLIEGGNDVINSDWPAFATGGWFGTVTVAVAVALPVAPLLSVTVRVTL